MQTKYELNVYNFLTSSHRAKNKGGITGEKSLQIKKD